MQLEMSEKQFQIDRVDRFLDNYIECWNEFHASFNDLAEGTIDANKRERTPLLAVCGVVVTILFGLSSQNVIDNNTLSLYLAIDGIIAIGIFLGYGIYTYSLSKIFSKTEATMITSTTYLQALRSSFNAVTFDISSLSPNRIADYFVLANLTDCSNKIRIGHEFNKITKMKRIALPTRDELLRIMKDWEPALQMGLETYNNSKKEFEQKYWEGYQFLIEEIKEYSKHHTTV